MFVSHLSKEEKEPLNKTLTHIDNETVPEDKTRTKWGIKFRNNENRLPGASGAESPYKEYRVSPELGERGPSAR